MHLLLENKSMHIWEIDYLTDSDDEDNDDAEGSSSGDSSDEGFQ